MNSGGLAWRVQTGGPVRSSPVVVGDGLYIGDNNGIVHALDRRTGGTRWQRDVGGAVTSTPAVYAGLVLVVTATECIALDAGSGEPRWRVQLGRELSLLTAG